MSFVAAAALSITLLIVAPVIAHLLRRGRAEPLPFPPTRLVPPARSVARQRARLEDRILFLVRASAVLLFALLGATPLVRCSRLSLDRASGASIALAIVLDDSLSMRAELPSGVSRWERAQRAALELAASARRGDAVAVVLAGKPARIALSPTTDLHAIERNLSALEVSDRATDLAGAVQIARTLLLDLPQRDRKLAVLSDFASEPAPAGQPAIWAPTPELSQQIEDCGVVNAERSSGSVSVSVACTSAKVASGRQLEALPGDPLATGGNSGAALGGAPLMARNGVQTVIIPVASGREVLGVRLTGADALARDDVASVGRASTLLEIAVNADAARAGSRTGGPSLVEQALGALGGVAVRPLSVLPDDDGQLNRYGALILDDPGGLGPERRATITAWVSKGGVAAALLGRRAESAAIGATLEPFAEGALPWQAATAKGLAPASIAWLGPEASGLSNLNAKGRVRLDGAAGHDVRVLARWDDGAPFLLERELGRGLILTFGLPSSAEDSDFGLRPGFLALIDHILSLSGERSGQRRGEAGVTFRFPESPRIEITGPQGPIAPQQGEAPSGRHQQVFTPELAGRYRIRSADQDEERIVGIAAAEVLAAPRPVAKVASAEAASGRRREVDASPEVARIMIGLLAVEIVLRLIKALSGRRKLSLKNTQTPKTASAA